MDKYKDRLCYECGKEYGYWEISDIYICDECCDKYYDLCYECYAAIPHKEIEWSDTCGVRCDIILP